MVQNVLYLNGLPSHVNLPFEYRTPLLSGNQMNLIFRCSEFRWLVYLVKLFLTTANFLLNVVVHQVGNVPHQQTDIRKLQRQLLKLCGKGKIFFQVILLEKVDADADLLTLAKRLLKTDSGAIETEFELSDLVLKEVGLAVDVLQVAFNAAQA